METLVTKIRLAVFVTCMAFCLACASTLHATTFSVSGEFWSAATSTLVDETAAAYVPAAGSAVYSTTPDAIFTVTGTDPTTLVNFTDGNGYDLHDFLNFGGNPVSFVTGSSFDSTATYLDDTLYQFQGTTTLTAATYTFTHDDGLVLYLDGVPVVNEPAPTAPSTESLTVTPGTYSFTLDYAEVDGPGADLITDLPLTGPVPTTVIPEPSSFLMLGSGLAAAAAMLRRRLFN